jgi:alkanesulfonate monooxygenase SsuD/methylene tetrahydromethanopterin reductase-like flavin-dependent oxidoreductase (luciferase family)
VRTLILTGLLLVPLTGGCGRSDGPARAARSAQANPTSTLDPQAVPSDLRHLTPLAQEWGRGDDVERLARVDSATPAQRAELRRAVDPLQARITAWLDSFGSGEMSQEAAAFMYMQLAVEEMVGRP